MKETARRVARRLITRALSTRTLSTQALFLCAAATLGLGGGGVLTLPPARAQAASPVPQVLDLRFGERDGGVLRFVVELEQGVAWRVSRLSAPNRIVIDLPVVSWPSSVPQGGHGLVGALRFGRFSETRSRIVLDLDSPALPRSVFMLGAPGGTRRLVLDLAPVGEVAFLEDLRRSLSSDPPLVKSVAAPPPPVPRPGHGDGRTIVIDAGHGGLDPGALASGGIQEKGLVLEYAQALAKRLRRSGELRVVMTREDDRFVALRERVRLAEAAGGDVFLSIHADANPVEKLRGASVYTLSETASDKEVAALAARENKSDILAGVDLSAHSDVVSQILIDLSQRDSVNASLSLASRVVAELRARGTQVLRKPTRSAGFAVLKSPNMPSVLIEVGYLSNRHDRAYLASDAGRAAVVDGIASAVEAFVVERSR